MSTSTFDATEICSGSRLVCRELYELVWDALVREAQLALPAGARYVMSWHEPGGMFGRTVALVWRYEPLFAQEEPWVPEARPAWAEVALAVHRGQGRLARMLA